jgi:hypothetical protein
MRAFVQKVFITTLVIGAIALTAYVVPWLLLILAGVLLAVVFRSIAKWICSRMKLLHKLGNCPRLNCYSDPYL